MGHDSPVQELCAELVFPDLVEVPVEIRLRRGGNAPSLETSLMEVASAVARCAPAAVRLGEDLGEEPPARPALTLVGAHRPPVHYLALPYGAEASPFAEALTLLASAARPTVTPCAEPRAPEVLVLVAPGCPNCPHAVRAALRLVADGARLRLAVVDVTAFPDLVSPFNPRTVPLTVVDRRIQVVGVTPPERLRRLLLQPGTLERDREVLAALLDSGRLAEAAGEVRRRGGLEAFVDLWRSSTLQTRMGLMLAADEVLASDARALDRAVEGLGRAVGAGDRSLRGDTAELLGKIATGEARTMLEALADDPDEDVAEAAREVLDEVAASGRSHPGG